MEQKEISSIVPEETERRYSRAVIEVLLHPSSSDKQAAASVEAVKYGLAARLSEQEMLGRHSHFLKRLLEKDLETWIALKSTTDNHAELRELFEEATQKCGIKFSAHASTFST